MFVKAGEKERFVAVADSVDTSDVEGGDFMFKSESLSGTVAVTTLIRVAYKTPQGKCN